MLEKPGGLQSRRVGEDSLGVRLPVGGRAQGLFPGGWGGSQRVAFCSAKLLISFGRVTASGILLSETAYLLCSTAFFSHALQA